MKKKTCPECGSVNLPSETMCDQCGCSLDEAETMPVASGSHCPKCSKALDEGLKFCDGCGTDLSQPEVPTQPPSPDPPAEPVSLEEEQIALQQPVIEVPATKPPAPKQGLTDSVAAVEKPETPKNHTDAPAEMAPQPTRSKNGSWKLSTVEGFHLGKEYLLFKDEMLLGRQDPEEDIYPDIDLEDQDDGYISRKHAFLRRNEAGFTVEDLGGENGTLVNQRPIPPFKPSQLSEGQVVRIGKVGLMLKMHQAPG